MTTNGHNQPIATAKPITTAKPIAITKPIAHRRLQYFNESLPLFRLPSPQSILRYLVVNKSSNISALSLPLFAFLFFSFLRTSSPTRSPCFRVALWRSLSLYHRHRLRGVERNKRVIPRHIHEYCSTHIKRRGSAFPRLTIEPAPSRFSSIQKRNRYSKRSAPHLAPTTTITS